MLWVCFVLGVTLPQCHPPFPQNIEFYCRHLATLDLLHYPANAFIEVSEFGAAFIKACVPEKIDGVAPFQRGVSNDKE